MLEDYLSDLHGFHEILLTKISNSRVDLSDVRIRSCRPKSNGTAKEALS